MTIPKSDRDAARARAEKATPGPWRPDVAWTDRPDSWRVFFAGHANPSTNTRDCTLPEADARHIAGMSPPVVIAWCDALDEMERLLREAREVVSVADFDNGPGEPGPLADLLNRIDAYLATKETP